MSLKLDDLRRSAARALRAARAAKSAEEFQVHYQRAVKFKSLAKNLGHLLRDASPEEKRRALRTGRGL